MLYLRLAITATLVRRATVTRIDKTHVFWSDADGAEHQTAADSVVLALGVTSDQSVARALESHGAPVQVVGDCRDAGYIEGAIRDGHRAGLAL